MRFAMFLCSIGYLVDAFVSMCKGDEANQRHAFIMALLFAIWARVTSPDDKKEAS